MTQENPESYGRRWCFYHKVLEQVHPSGRLTCAEAWRAIRQDERTVQSIKDNQNPDPLLREIRDTLKDLVALFNNNAPEVFVKPRETRTKYVDQDERLSEDSQQRRKGRRINL